MPSFDIVSEVDMHEANNAVDQANREIDNRFDFKGSNAKFSLKDDTVQMTAPADFQLKQMLDILKDKLMKRKVDIKCLEVKDPAIAIHEAKQEVVIRQGLDADLCRKIVKQIKNEKLKVQAQIQGDKVRVTGKKRDDLQNVIAMLKESKLDMPLQYNNFRD